MIQSLDRGLEILCILAESKSRGVTELAEDLKVNKSTVFRLLETMEKRDLVQQDEITAKYRLDRPAAYQRRPRKESRYYQYLETSLKTADGQYQGERSSVHVHKRQGLRGRSGKKQLSDEGFCGNWP
jgi:predicted ArsR family transcriptional regulator